MWLVYLLLQIARPEDVPNFDTWSPGLVTLTTEDSDDKVTTLRIILAPTSGGSASLKNMANTVCYVPCGMLCYVYDWEVML